MVAILRSASGLAIMALLLAACAGAPNAPVRLYQLGARTAAMQSAPIRFASVGVGPIQWPEYLDRRPLLTRLDAHTLQAADNDRWAEPLDLNFARVLREDLAASLGTTRVVAYPWNGAEAPQVSLHLEVLQFDSTSDGAATLRARWRLVERGSPDRMTEHLGEWRAEARDASPAAAAAAQSDTLVALARDIASALAGMQP